jgi:hypothetical protein
MNRPGYRVAMIDRTRFYVCNDELRWSSKTYRSREAAQMEADRLNAGKEES